MATGTESSVKTELEDFLKVHGLQDNVSDIDDIVLNYVLSILEDLGDSDSAEDNIDVDTFIEMMDAYIPGFANIESVKVCEWMFELASKLSTNNNASKRAEEPESPSLNPDLLLGAFYSEDKAFTRPRLHNSNSTGESERTNSECSVDEIDEQIEQLVEMFPDTVRLELTHCIHSVNGDLEQAVQLILHRQEAGIAITEEKKSTERRKKGIPILDDRKTKEQLMERYAFIDVDEDKRQYKPSVPKSEPKKLVRYLDSQVVNTKGQRFTEIKKEDNEDMKKTYINLKPARKYRFH